MTAVHSLCQLSLLLQIVDVVGVTFVSFLSVLYCFFDSVVWLKVLANLQIKLRFFLLLNKFINYFQSRFFFDFKLLKIVIKNSAIHYICSLISSLFEPFESRAALSLIKGSFYFRLFFFEVRAYLFGKFLNCKSLLQLSISLSKSV